MAKRGVELDQRDFLVEGLSTKVENPFVVLGFNLLSFFLLGQQIDNVDNYYFSSVLLFALPMTYECMRFTPIDRIARIIRYLHRVCLWLIIAACTLGLTGVVGMVQVTGEAHIMVSQGYVICGGLSVHAAALWYACGMSLFVSTLYIFAPKTKAEHKLIS